jgi:hypothetical protein
VSEGELTVRAGAASRPGGHSSTAAAAAAAAGFCPTRSHPESKGLYLTESMSPQSLAQSGGGTLARFRGRQVASIAESGVK